MRYHFRIDKTIVFKEMTIFSIYVDWSFFFLFSPSFLNPFAANIFITWLHLTTSEGCASPWYLPLKVDITFVLRISSVLKNLKQYVISIVSCLLCEYQKSYVHIIFLYLFEVKKNKSYVYIIFLYMYLFEVQKKYL